MQAMSGTQFGIFLDLKPYGPIAAPWPLAKCPANGFVLYKPKFSKAELAKLKPYVASAEYRTLGANHTDYYLAARLARVAGEPAVTIAQLLLRATWEAGPQEDEQGKVKVDTQRYAQYAGEALDAFKAVLAQPADVPEQWQTDQLVALELERRLGRFEEAQARLDALAGRTEFASGTMHTIVELQRKLIAARDNQPKQVPEEQ
ncbi:MAG: hypothetical protein ACLGI6_06485 [Gammaproteobacteria bacterium]